MKVGSKRSSWKDRFFTLLVIPERTRRVHKVVVSFTLLKVGLFLAALAVVFLILVGIDYVHVLGRVAENKQLKGENFRLRQEMQVIKNRVENMEATVERVRNYAKKLQMLTGQGESGEVLPMGPVEPEGGVLVPPTPQRAPASKKRRRKESKEPEGEKTGENVLRKSQRLSLDERVERLQTVSLSSETELSKLQVLFLARRALANATPSILPINGWISSEFGYRRHPYQGTYRLHSGIDIAADPGTPVRAPADGTVIFSGYKEGYGKVLVVDHSYGIHTVYAHNARLFANAGDRVRRSEVIAEVGSTGRSTGPHLHYEVRKNGIPVNPVHYFSRVRF